MVEFSTQQPYDTGSTMDTTRIGDVNHSLTYDRPEGCPSPLSLAGNITITITITILLIFGLLGNMITITVIVKNKSLRTNFNKFLASLCASDLMSACVCSPLWTYGRTWGFSHWDWGEGSCKLYWLTDLMTNFTASLHILSFCILRFIALSRPFTAPTSRLSHNHFRVYIACLWLSSMLISSPYCFMATVKDDGLYGDPWSSCSVGLDYQEFYNIYTIVAYSIFFYLPSVIILVLSIASMRHLSEMIEKSSLSRISDPEQAAAVKQRNQAARTQMQLICACFFLGYIPTASYHLWASGDVLTCDSYAADYWVGVATYIILRVSECLNPVMYNLGCQEMRLASLKLVKEDIFCCTSTTTARAINFSSVIENSNPRDTEEGSEISLTSTTRNDVK